MKNRRLIIILSVISLLLLVPLIAMQFSNEVKWEMMDFVIAGILIFGTGIVCELILRKVKKIKYRIIIYGIILFGLFIIWAELAAGIFGTSFAGS